MTGIFVKVSSKFEVSGLNGIVLAFVGNPGAVPATPVGFVPELLLLSLDLAEEGSPGFHGGITRFSYN